MNEYRRLLSVAVTLLVLAAGASADTATWSGSDGDWFASPSRWLDANGQPCAAPAGYDGSAVIDGAAVTISSPTAPTGPIGLGVLTLGTHSSASLTSDRGLGVNVTIGTGSLTVTSGGLSGGLIAGANCNATLDITDGLTCTSNLSFGATGSTLTNSANITVRTGDMIVSRSNGVGFGVAAGSAIGIPSANFQLVVSNGSLGSATTPLPGPVVIGFTVATGSDRTVAGRATASVEAQDMYCNGDITCGDAFMTSGAIAPALAANGTLIVHGTAHFHPSLLNSLLLVGGGSGTGVVDIYSADIGTQAWDGYRQVAVGSGTSNAAKGTLILRHGSLWCEYLTVGENTMAPGNDPYGRLTLGAHASGWGVTLGSGSDLEFLLRPTADDSGSLTAGDITLGGKLDVTLDGYAPAPGTSLTLISGGFGGTAFANVANGGMLTSTDGSTQFVVHYGAGSTFDPNSVVVTVAPEPATLSLLILGGLVALRHRRA